MDTKTLYEKLAAVPFPIKTHLGSEETIDALGKIENQFHLPVGSLGSSKLIQKLQIKEIAPEDFTGELAVELKLEKNNAILISEAIEKSILAPIKKDFDDYGININLLENFRIPTPKILSEIIKPPTVISPKPISAKLPATPPLAPAAPAPKIISETFTAALSVGTTPLASNKNNPGAAPQPTKPSNQGWSKQSPQQPVVKLGQVAPAMPIPAKPVAPNVVAPAAQKPAAPRVGNTMSEFDRLGLNNRAPSPATSSAPMPTPKAPPAPAAQPKPSDPAPMMLHQISGTTAISQSPNLGMAAGTKNQINPQSPPPPSPTKSAVLEFGIKTPQVVRYSEYKTQTPPPIPANNAPRQITQIVPPQATPSAQQPPKPPTPPRPTLSGAQQKVIVKDFL